VPWVPSTPRGQLADLLAVQDDQPSSVQLRAKAPEDVRLEVEGIGRVTLPVPADEARRLRELGRPARFGRGEETLTDATIRDTWEIPRELVRVEWPGEAGLDAALADIHLELQLPLNCELTAELHSLLVYEEGQFFLPHQDSEKHDAMIATLVVMLPSEHTGGELVVHHLGDTTTYRGSTTHVSLVAFYTDCRHEVLPVTSGHRIVLTYNLLLHGEPDDHVPDEAVVGELAGLLDEHFATPVRHRYRDTIGEPPNRLAFLLDHEYTERGLGWARLKGSDASRASLLRTVAQAAGCEAVLCLAEIKETWEAYRAGEEDGYRRWNDEDEFYEDEEDESEAAGPGKGDDRYRLNELVDSSLVLTRWIDPSDSSAEAISLTVADAEVCAVTPTRELQPYSSDYEGYMGNYGNTLDRWYRRAAVLVWPEDRAFTNRAEVSPSWALDELCTLARAGDPAYACSAAATLAPFWDAAVRLRDPAGQLLGQALPTALAMDDAETASMLLRPFRVESLAPHHLANLAELARRYGGPWTDALLQTWCTGRRSWSSAHGPSREQWLSSLPTLCEAAQAEGVRGASTARRLLAMAWEGLATEISSATDSPSAAVRQRLDGLGEPLAAVTRAAAIARDTELRDTIVDFCRRQGDAVTRCVIPALRAAAADGTGARRGAFAQLAADQAARLRTRLARPARTPGDWSVELPDGCACQLCGTLRSFLAAPERRALEWPLAKDRRSHIHSRIDHAELPVSHTTRRQGSPHVLVLAKTPQLFEREARQRAQDQADLRWLDEEWSSARG
jgi:2OG-Fe(II) oxygenase superfamily